MEFQQIISHPFTWGLALGLLVAGFILKSAIASKLRHHRENRHFQTEMRELQGHLNTQLKITATGNESLLKQLEELKIQNENLRVNLTTLQSKPDKSEQRQLRLNEMAITALREQAPGFAGAWEKAMRQAEEEMGSVEKGFSKLMRKVIPAFSPSPAKRLSTDAEGKDDANELV